MAADNSFVELPPELEQMAANDPELATSLRYAWTLGGALARGEQRWVDWCFSGLFEAPTSYQELGYPLKDNLLFDYDEFVRLFAELPDEIGCLIDTGHAMLNGWDIVKLIKTLGPRIRGYHLNNNDGKHDSHYPLYDSEGYYSPQQIDEMLRAIAIYSPNADLGIEYAPDGRFTTESLYADIRRVVRVTEEAASQMHRV